MTAGFGNTFLKAQYVGYTDGTFSNKTVRSAQIIPGASQFMKQLKHCCSVAATTQPLQSAAPKAGPLPSAVVHTPRGRVLSTKSGVRGDKPASSHCGTEALARPGHLALGKARANAEFGNSCVPRCLACLWMLT